MSQSQAKSTIEQIVLSLHQIGAINFGTFTLKSGLTSPIYIDLRLIISEPMLLQQVATAMFELLPKQKFNVICGVPYTALPIATIISMNEKLPMVMRRKEAKTYGMKKIIEGIYKDGDNCLIIEDLVTSGLSVFETIQPITQSGMNVTDVVVLIDRQQGGRANIEAKGITLHSVLTISEIIEILLKHQKIDETMVQNVKQFIADNQVNVNVNENNKVEVSKSIEKVLTYGERSKQCSNQIAAQLLSIMENKKTNLCLSADVTTSSELLQLAEQTGPYICLFKTHIDIIIDFTPQLIEQLQSIANRYNFLLFEDRKFADIGNTVLHQYTQGIYKISSWSHIINCHIIPGSGIIDGLQSGVKNHERGLLLIAEMSSAGNFATGNYTDANVKLAEQYNEFVIGFICQHRLTSNPNFIHMTPGVQLTSSSDALGQQYNTPSSVISGGSDVIIVGRGITGAANRAEEAKRYMEEGWKAYLQRTGGQ